ncbi:MAG TPA: hypothetical protein PLC99_25340, partial [Verrucomicrobiota bacterium]|nr:hypothetical protein [Verrucomicrobiota bacterium]
MAWNSVFCNVLLTLLASVANLLAGNVFAQAPDKLPLVPDYHGEIRRGADGKLMALPASAPAAKNRAGDGAPKTTMVVGSSEKITTLTEA